MIKIAPPFLFERQGSVRVSWQRNDKPSTIEGRIETVDGRVLHDAVEITIRPARSKRYEVRRGYFALPAGVLPNMHAGESYRLISDRGQSSELIVNETVQEVVSVATGLRRSIVHFRANLKKPAARDGSGPTLREPQNACSRPSALSIIQELVMRQPQLTFDAWFQFDAERNAIRQPSKIGNHPLDVVIDAEDLTTFYDVKPRNPMLCYREHEEEILNLARRSLASMETWPSELTIGMAELKKLAQTATA